MGTFPACWKRLLCPPRERRCRKAGESTWMGEKREGKRNRSAVLVLQDPGGAGALGQTPEILLHVSLED